MRGRRIAWLVSLALMAAGGVLAHVYAYRLLAPAHAVHGGHSRLPHWELCLAACATVVLAALVVLAATRTRAGRAPAPPLWLFALLPPLGFTVQEHLERVLHHAAAPYATVLEPVFLLGLLLQVPFALAAYLVARAVLALAVAVVAGLRARPRPRLQSLSVAVPVVAHVRRPRRLAVAAGRGQRAPPPLPA